MQLASGSHIPDGLLAANALLSEKLHQGFAAPKSTLHQGFSVSISSTPLGIISPLYDDGTGSRYTGKERDAESGLDYFGARYYASSMGRFMSPDWAAQEEPVPYAKMDDPQSLNLYSYVLNNPLSHTDPDGHDCPTCEKAWSFVAGVAAGVANVVPQSINLINSGGNAVLSLTPTSYRIPMMEEIQPDAHASATGMAVGSAAVAAYPVAAAAAEVKTAGMVIGEVRAATAGEAVPESIPAGPGSRPSPTQQKAINEMGDAHGCHECGAPSSGRPSGNWTGDHVPATSQNTSGGPQVYKPHCAQCSASQGGRVAAENRAARAAAKKTEVQQ
jgi:RHS repeat-associated protein